MDRERNGWIERKRNRWIERGMDGWREDGRTEEEGNNEWIDEVLGNDGRTD